MVSFLRAGRWPTFISRAPAWARAGQDASARPHPEPDPWGKVPAGRVLTLQPIVPLTASSWPAVLTAGFPLSPLPSPLHHPPAPRQQGPGPTISSGFRSMFKTSCGSGWPARCSACSTRSTATFMFVGMCVWPGMWPIP